MHQVCCNDKIYKILFVRIILTASTRNPDTSLLEEKRNVSHIKLRRGRKVGFRVEIQWFINVIGKLGFINLFCSLQAGRK